ncbi:MAG: S-methyl-5-thioribose-1-phosphate isomerase [Terrimicrobiaceae bacterium]|nr:S-methyl-5-thioribose-1-phosphate isomerase [Terrimicrobiaceae bacterium]
MKIAGVPHRTIWLAGPGVVRIIDQRWLPHRLVFEDLSSCAAAAAAIRDMHVRGAGLIGATAGFGMYLAAREVSAQDCEDLARLRQRLREAAEFLKATRPTAVNLAWAADRVAEAAGRQPGSPGAVAGAALEEAQRIADEDAACCEAIGRHGLPLIERIWRERAAERRPVNILTHCNAGWLAFVDFGSATAPIYAAHDAGIPVHGWVDETRPRCQGARLTAWELANHGVPHHVVADNAGGHLMQRGQVDLVLVGTDRTTRTGDVANKIGTYLKALAARDNDIPFHVALPSSSFDWSMTDGLAQIPVEERAETEVTHAAGWLDGREVEVRVANASSPAANPGFDVTPARLVTALITERGVCGASEPEILRLFPERA